MYELHVQCILVFPAIHACMKQENTYNIIIIKCKYESFVDQIYVQCFHPFLPVHTLRDRLLANKCGRWRPTSQLLVCICRVVWSYGWWMIVIIWISNLQKNDDIAILPAGVFLTLKCCTFRKWILIGQWKETTNPPGNRSYGKHDV